MTRSGQTERTRSGLPCFPDQGGSLAAAGSLAFPYDVSIARGCVTRRWRSQAWSTPIDPRGRLRRQRVCRAPGARLAPHRASSPPRRIRRAPQRIPYRFVRAFGTALERRGRSVCVRTRRIVWSRGCVVACVVPAPASRLVGRGATRVSLQVNGSGEHSSSTASAAHGETCSSGWNQCDAAAARTSAGAAAARVLGRGKRRVPSRLRTRCARRCARPIARIRLESDALRQGARRFQCVGASQDPPPRRASAGSLSWVDLRASGRSPARLSSSAPGSARPGRATDRRR